MRIKFEVIDDYNTKLSLPKALYDLIFKELEKLTEGKALKFPISSLELKTNETNLRFRFYGEAKRRNMKISVRFDKKGNVLLAKS